MQGKIKLSRRDFVSAGIGALAGFAAGTFIYSRRDFNERLKTPISPMFRVQIYSKDWINENFLREDEYLNCTEFSYISSMVSWVDVYRNRELIDGLQNCPANSVWIKLGDFQEKGSVKYSFVYKGKDGEEIKLDIPVHFENNLELLSQILSARFKADNDVYFLDSDENDFPRRCLVLSNGSSEYNIPIHYWVHGPEALAGISKKDLFEYWSNPDKYKSLEVFLDSHGFEIKI